MQSWAAAPPIFVNNLWRTNIPVISTIIIIVIVIIVITLSLSREPISIDNVKNTLFFCALSLRHITVKYLQSLMIKLKIEMDQRSYSWTTWWRPEKGSSVHHRGPAKAIISRETKDGWEI